MARNRKKDLRTSRGLSLKFYGYERSSTTPKPDRDGSEREATPVLTAKKADIMNFGVFK
ncbi:MAG: hypothetical protein U9R44_03455 [Candidatus Omnitrophota bacterium]|nr:hypothetical protein [Candidatus Omnitrophota bacterium]